MEKIPKPKGKNITGKERMKAQQNIRTNVDKIRNVNEKDKQRLVNNIMDKIDRIENANDINDMVHFIDQWGGENDMTVAAAREHFDDCKVCNTIRSEIIAGTNMDYARLIPGEKIPNPVQHIMDF